MDQTRFGASTSVQVDLMPIKMLNPAGQLQYRFNVVGQDEMLVRGPIRASLPEAMSGLHDEVSNKLDQLLTRTWTGPDDGSAKWVGDA
jgi:hypothetical protein